MQKEVRALTVEEKAFRQLELRNTTYRDRDALKGMLKALDEQKDVERLLRDYEISQNGMPHPVCL